MRQDSVMGPMARGTDSIAALVRRAMTYLAIDRQAALRCLNDATALLDSGAQAPMQNAQELPVDYRSGGLARWQARKTLAYIEENLGAKLAIDQLADLVSLSKSHFSRAFKRSLERPPMMYVLIRRVERAKAMMTTTNEQLTGIALACGFADQSHLNRAFRRIVGISPGVWRRTCVEDGVAGLGDT